MYLSFYSYIILDIIGSDYLSIALIWNNIRNRKQIGKKNKLL